MQMSDEITVSETPTETTPTITETPQKQTEPPKPEMISLKVNGKVVEVTRERAIAMAQQSEAANERFSEASKMRKEAEELLTLTKQKDFLKLAERSGMNKAEARAALEQVLLNMYQEEDMSPEEREMKELKAFKQQRDEELKSQQEQEANERISKEEAKYLEDIEQEMVNALEKTSLPPNPLYAKLSANYMSAALSQGYDLSPTEAVKLVEQDQIALVKSMLDGLDPLTLQSMLGPKVVKAIRDAGVAKVKSAEAPLKRPTAPTPPTKPVPPTSGKPKRTSDIFDEIRRGVGSL